MDIKNWNRYTVMHGNRKVACIHRDGSCVIYNTGLLPYNLYLEKTDEGDLDARVSNLQNFYYWCSSRILTLDRKYAKEILNSLGKKQAVTDMDRAEIAIEYHCLSLTDVFWVKQYRSKEKFEDISLFRHSLSDAFVDVCLRGKMLTLQNSEMLKPLDAAGDVGTQGVSPKAWVRRKGKICLFKDGSARDVNAEILASRILDCFAVNHVKYYEDYFDGQKVSACELITSEEKSIVTAEYAEIYAANHGTDLLSIVYEKSEYEYFMMNIADYLTGNTDRHWGNWGFFADGRTNKLLGLHPLMDFNKAFTSYDGLAGAKCLTVRNGMTQQEAAAEAVKRVGLNQISEVKREWFDSESVWKTFCARLEFLKSL